MISFKEFLNEAIIKKWDQTSIEVDQAIALLNAHCKDGLKAIDNSGLIWRGIQDNKLKKFGAVDSSTGIRTSKDTSNLYQVMMDASSALKDFPSRSKSFICGSSYSVASGYGNKNDVYAFVPFDGTRIAVANDGDMFHTEIKNQYTNYSSGVDTFNSRLHVWLRDNFGIKPKGKNYKYTNIAEIDSALAKVKDKKFLAALEVASWVTSTKAARELFEIVNIDTRKRMTAISSAILTPASLKIKLVTFGNKLPAGKEVWFSGKAIAVRKDMMDNIIAIIKKEKKAGVREAVNDKVFFTDFKKEKEILDGAYKLVATAGYVGYGAKAGFKSNQFRIVAKTAKGAEVGWVNFEKHDDHLEALDLSIQPAHRRKGIATEMYKLARECGNDVAPSKLQTGMGKTFWNKDHSK